MQSLHHMLWSEDHFVKSHLVIGLQSSSPFFVFLKQVTSDHLVVFKTLDWSHFFLLGNIFIWISWKKNIWQVSFIIIPSVSFLSLCFCLYFFHWKGFTDQAEDLRGFHVHAHLIKGSRGFGFNIVGGSRPGEFLQVYSVTASGPSALKTGNIWNKQKKTLHSLVNVFILMYLQV